MSNSIEHQQHAKTGYAYSQMHHFSLFNISNFKSINQKGIITSSLSKHIKLNNESDHEFLRTEVSFNQLIWYV